MGLIQEVQLLLDKASAKKLSDDMAAAGKTGGSALTREVGGSFDTLKAGAAKLGAAIVAAFAIQRVVGFAKAAIAASIEADASWARLGKTLAGVGVKFADVRNEVDKVIDGLKETRFDNDALAESLGSLVLQTGDYNRSLSALSVVADLASARHLDLDTAAMLVGKAMNGNTTLLERYGITVAKGADGLEALRKQFKGFAEAEGKEMIGQVGILANSWDDAREAIGGFLIEAGSGASILTTLTGIVRGLSEALNIYAVSVKHASEIALGETEGQLRRQKASIENSLTTRGGKVVRGSVAGLDAINPNDPAAMRSLDKAQQDYVRLLAVQRELTREVNEAARAQAVRTKEAHKAAEEAARLAKLTRQEAETDADKKKRLADEEFRRIEKVWTMFGSGDMDADTRRFPGGAISSDTMKAFGIGPSTPFAATAPADVWAGTSAQSKGLQESIASNVADALRSLSDSPPPTLTEGWDSLWSSIAGSSAQIGDALLDSWGGAFEQMKQDAFTLGDLFQGLGNSIAKSLIQGVGAFARTKVLENVAHAIEEGAKSLGAFAKGNAAGGILHLQAAAKHVAASVAWSALGGAANSATMGSTSRGGIGSGYRTGANTKDSLESERRGTQIFIRVDGISPTDPRHGDLLISTLAGAIERHGESAIYVNGKRSS